MQGSVRYPWDQWFKRRKFRLVRHRQFNCQCHSMGVQVRNAAAKRGIRISINIDEDTDSLSVTVVSRSSEAA